MDFADNVVDCGAQEINVNGVSSVERISDGQVRVSYFIRRKGELSVAIHLIWDRQEWLSMWRVWDMARGRLAGENSEASFFFERAHEIH